ncbi:MAG: 2-succinyl-5-enolpyruvyl-6-hydroxy-3-cyclohexene-1-carboxylic-acid synthase [Bacteroidetes bacterium GWF2_42_66]|nr:MAG: 2-succinyl-5-enolpyruvyl-6-hydroxy-3-cyclohexene-1-carboxylic-acid synthase [Bacteroidetes bacterium GWA2_42_15]OFY01773.1 MAG: 2-succinyl-5-enolpyruvyl-6-hydroxy-3-cyclohexene-1-carboxylic-acid synthase [Bacteroidetes bacterium GWE2_42_39]OFY44934.1 MAG: 2-succinyl-5-enolpyruvyl-6-hydroxy-3-cyclohexene-1-carboxylic-acid synthase [Bacteroidetes bacterium GWF2_42_66]HBL76064.1 2-succinyl-5-enolpyruvyl-6-hydroxy-3-cyclohexene-1-carboxylic-acid synthase [Prolixibacteraceae bacterium]HCR902
MISDKKHIQQLAALLLKKGITDIVISPGSRNAPMINTFAGRLEFNCRNVVDERSGAYFALGLALEKQNPVALVCSSGTATLNYAPAVAEAFYQNVPLVLLTADRPEYWIDQAENQCIRQENIYSNFSKKNFTLPLGESEKELWFAARSINECLNAAVTGTPGPVHINIPLEEPLHNFLEAELPDVKLIETAETESVLTETELEKLAGEIQQAKKILMLAGQQNPNPGLENSLAAFCGKAGAAVLTEHLSNLSDTQFCNSVDLLMSAILNDRIEDFQPDLLISFGGTLVSKSVKQFLRKYKPAQHWHLSLSGEHFDTYQSLTKVVNMDTADFFDALSEKLQKKDNGFQRLWKNKEMQVNQLRDAFIAETEFCDLKVFGQLASSIPENSVVHLGNSSPVRYTMICPPVKNAMYFGNRGTSGIDGCLSTAVGFASDSEKINTVIVGDLSFFYDSNALWNKYLGANLRIIVIHNGGGNIFSMIKGPGESPVFNEHFFAENTRKAEALAKAFDLNYFSATSATELISALTEFYSPLHEKPVLLEIFTYAETNTRVFRELFKCMK